MKEDNIYILILPIMLFVLTGCDLIPQENEKLREEMMKEIEDREMEWRDKDINRYKFTYSQQVGDLKVDSISVFVDEGAVDSVHSSRPIEKEDMLVETVESFFRLIEQRVQSNGMSQYSVSFDEEWSYPTEFMAIYEERPREEISTINVTSME